MASEPNRIDCNRDNFPLIALSPSMTATHNRTELVTIQTPSTWLEGTMVTPCRRLEVSLMTWVWTVWHHDSSGPVLARHLRIASDAERAYQIEICRSQLQSTFHDSHDSQVIQFKLYSTSSEFSQNCQSLCKPNLYVVEMCIHSNSILDHHALICS